MPNKIQFTSAKGNKHLLDAEDFSANYDGYVRANQGATVKMFKDGKAEDIAIGDALSKYRSGYSYYAPADKASSAVKSGSATKKSQSTSNVPQKTTAQQAMEVGNLRFRKLGEGVGTPDTASDTQVQAQPKTAMPEGFGQMSTDVATNPFGSNAPKAETTVKADGTLNIPKDVAKQPEKVIGKDKNGSPTLVDNPNSIKSQYKTVQADIAGREVLDDATGSAIGDLIKTQADAARAKSRETLSGEGGNYLWQKALKEQRQALSPEAMKEAVQDENFIQGTLAPAVYKSVFKYDSNGNITGYQDKITKKAQELGISEQQFVQENVLPNMVTQAMSQIDAREDAKNEIKTTGDYLLAKLNNSFLGQAMSLVSDSREQRQSKARALGQYEDRQTKEGGWGNLGERVLGEAAGFVGDAPLFAVGGEAGKLASMGTGKVLGAVGKEFGSTVVGRFMTGASRYATQATGKSAASKMALAQAEKTLSANVGVMNNFLRRYAASAPASAVNLGTFGGLKEGMTEMSVGEKPSFASVGKAILDSGFAMAKDGLALPLGSSLLGSFASKYASSALERKAMGIAGFGVEGGTFMGLEYAKDPDAFNATDSFFNTFTMLAGMKAGGKLAHAKWSGDKPSSDTGSIFNPKNWSAKWSRFVADTGNSLSNKLSNEQLQELQDAFPGKPLEQLVDFDFDKRIKRYDSGYLKGAPMRDENGNVQYEWIDKDGKVVADQDQDPNRQALVKFAQEIAGNKEIAWETKQKLFGTMFDTVETNRPILDHTQINGNQVSFYSSDGQLISRKTFDSKDELQTYMFNESTRKRVDDTLAKFAELNMTIPDDFTMSVTDGEGNTYSVNPVDFLASLGVDAERANRLLLADPKTLKAEDLAMMLKYSEGLDIIYNELHKGEAHPEHSKAEGEQIATTIDTATGEGVDVVSQMKNDSEIAYDNARRVLEENGADDVDALLASGDINDMMQFAMNEEQQRALIDYVNAKAKYDGFIERTGKNINEVVDSEWVDLAHRGTIDGNKTERTNAIVVDVNGKQMILQDGEVDTANGRILSESGMLIVIDPLTLEIDYIKADDAKLVDVVDADTYKQSRIQQLGEEITARYNLMPTERPSGNAEGTGTTEATEPRTAPEEGLQGTASENATGTEPAGETAGTGAEAGARTVVLDTIPHTGGEVVNGKKTEVKYDFDNPDVTPEQRATALLELTGNEEAVKKLIANNVKKHDETVKKLRKQIENETDANKLAQDQNKLTEAERLLDTWKKSGEMFKEAEEIVDNAPKEGTLDMTEGGETEVETSGTATEMPKTAPVEAPKTTKNGIPLKKDGNAMLERGKATATQITEYLYDEIGMNDEQVNQFLEAKMAELKKRDTANKTKDTNLRKKEAELNEPNVPMDVNDLVGWREKQAKAKDEYAAKKAELDKARNELEAEKADIAEDKKFWQNVAEKIDYRKAFLDASKGTEIDEEKELNKQDIRKEIIDKFGDPQTPDEFICANWLVINQESLRAETGYNAKDYADMKQYLRKNGVSIQEAAESIYGDMPEGMREQMTDQDVRDIILDVIGEGGPMKYMENRVQKSDAERIAHEEQMREEYYQDNYGMSYDEYLEYENAQRQRIIDELNDIPREEIDRIFEEETKNPETNDNEGRNSERGTEEESSEHESKESENAESDSVLQEAQPDDTAGVEVGGDNRGQVPVGRDSDTATGTVPEGASERDGGRVEPSGEAEGTGAEEKSATEKLVSDARKAGINADIDEEHSDYDDLFVKFNDGTSVQTEGVDNIGDTPYTLFGYHPKEIEGDYQRMGDLVAEYKESHPDADIRDGFDSFGAFSTDSKTLLDFKEWCDKKLAEEKIATGKGLAEQITKTAGTDDFKGSLDEFRKWMSDSTDEELIALRKTLEKRSRSFREINQELQKRAEDRHNAWMALPPQERYKDWDNERLEGERKDTQESVDETEKRIAEYTEELDKYQAELDDAEKNLAKYKGDLKRAKGTALNELDKVELSAEASKKVDARIAKLGALEGAEPKKMQANLKSLKDYLENLNEEISELKDRIPDGEMADDLESLEQFASDVEGWIEDIKNESDKEDKQDLCDQAFENLTELLDENADESLIRSIRAGEKLLELGEEGLDKVIGKYLEAEKNVEDAEIALESNPAEINSLKNSLDELKTDNEANKKLLAEVEGEQKRRSEETGGEASGTGAEKDRHVDIDEIHKNISDIKTLNDVKKLVSIPEDVENSVTSQEIENDFADAIEVALRNTTSRIDKVRGYRLAVLFANEAQGLPTSDGFGYEKDANGDRIVGSDGKFKTKKVKGLINAIAEAQAKKSDAKNEILIINKLESDGKIDRSGADKARKVAEGTYREESVKLAVYNREKSYRTERIKQLQEKYPGKIGKNGEISFETLEQIYHDTKRTNEFDSLFNTLLRQAKTLSSQMYVGDEKNMAYTTAGTTTTNSLMMFNLDLAIRSMSSKYDFSETIIHELLHNSIGSIITAYNKGGKYRDALTEKQKKAVEELHNFFETTIKDNERFKRLYASSDEHELVSEVANKKLRDTLNHLGLWDTFVNKVKQFIHDAIFGTFGRNVKFNYKEEEQEQLDRIVDNLVNSFDTDIHALVDADIKSFVSKYAEAKENHGAATRLLDPEDTDLIKDDRNAIEELNSGKTKKVYRAMQVIDGQLYPPMAAKIGGEMVEGAKPGDILKADEHPEMIKMVNGKPQFVLDKGGKDATGKKATSVPARYNPYWHTSNSMLNDQFKSAWIRPNMVVVECEIPESELTSGYKAEYAKDAVGMVPWKSGSVTGELVKQGHPGREVYLSRYCKIGRIVPEAEAAQHIKEFMGGRDVEIPVNTVTPKLRAELEKAGVKIGAPEKGVKMDEQIEEALERGLSVDNTLTEDKSSGTVAGNTDEAYAKAVETGDKETARKIIDEVAKEHGYTIHAYHGTGRADRVGNKFLPERATSGPMAFFTSSKEIAESYAKDKKDTSLDYSGEDLWEYKNQFKAKANGWREMTLDKLWNYLPSEARKEIAEKAGHIRSDWDGDGKVIYDENTTNANGGFEYQVEEARGNVLKALLEQWLESGNLYGREGDFLDVLEMTGINKYLEKPVKWNDPNYREEKVYDTYIKMNKPFDTNEAFNDKFLDRLEKWWSKQNPDKYTNESMSADMWDKNNISVEEWIEKARQDVEGNTTYMFTTIPDGVTAYLKKLGYDGIIDKGGKFSGENHEVYIPFSGEQVKYFDTETRDDKGNIIMPSERFNDSENDLRYRSGEPGAKTLGAVAKDSQIAKDAQGVIDSLGGKGRVVTERTELGSLGERVLAENPNAKGWYDTKTGEVTVYLPNCESSRDIEMTIFHEKVGHEGLRKVVGEDRWNNFLHQVFRGMSKADKKAIIDRANSKGWNFNEAIDEWLSEKAENVENTVENNGRWQKICNAWNKLMRMLGIKNSMTENDIRQALWLSKNMLENKTGSLDYLAKKKSFEYKLSKRVNKEQRSDDGRYFVNKSEHSSGDYGGKETPTGTSDRTIYDDGLKSVGFLWTEAHQNGLRSLQLAQEAVMGEGNAVKDSENAFMALNRLPSTDMVAMDEFKAKHAEPFTEHIRKVMSSFEGENVEERYENLEKYLIAKHGLERNRVFYVRDVTNKLYNSDKAEDKALAEQIREDFLTERKRLKDGLDNGNISISEYYNELDTWIQNNVGSEYEASKMDKSGLSDTEGFAEWALGNGEYDEAKVLDYIKVCEDKMGKADVDKLYSHINDINNYTIDKQYESGMSTTGQKNRAKEMFDWYVPLRGFDADTAEDMWNYIGREGKPSVVGMRTADHRVSRAKNPIATMIVMANGAIMQGNRNMAKMNLFRLAKNNKNKLFTELNLYYEKKTSPSGEEYLEPIYPTLTEGMTGDEMNAAMKNYESVVANMREAGAEIIKDVNKHGDLDIKFERESDAEQHMIHVMVGGKRRTLFVNGNPRVAQAVNGMIHDASNQVTHVSKAVNNFMSQMATSKSATFILRNGTRDFEYATATLTAVEGTGYTKEFAKNYASLSPTSKNEHSMLSLFKRYREDKLDMNNDIDRKFLEYVKNGGMTGFVQMSNVEAQQSEIEGMLKSGKIEGIESGHKLITLGNKAGEKFQELWFSHIETLNEAVENQTRFATYLTSRNMKGRTIARSIYDAKNAGVNFNLSGAGWGTSNMKMKDESNWHKFNRLAASSSATFMRNSVVFYNAGIQGMSRTAQVTFKGDKKQMYRAIASVAAMPMALGLLAPSWNQIMTHWDTDEDKKKFGDNPYAQLPEYERRQNLCLYVGHGRFVKIPLAIELRAFYGIGDLVAGASGRYLGYDWARGLDGEGVVNPESAMSVGGNYLYGLVKELAQITPVDIFGGSKAINDSWWGGVAGVVIPSSVAPFFAAGLGGLFGVHGFNVGWTGAPISHRGDYNSNNAEWKKAAVKTPKGLVDVTRWLSNATGGDEVRGGWINLNPSELQYIADQYGAGAFKDLSQLSGALFNSVAIGLDYMSKGTTDREFNVGDLPVAKAFFRSRTTSNALAVARTRYYNYVKEASETNKNISDYKAESKKSIEGNAKYIDYINTPAAIRAKALKPYQTAIKKLQEAKNKATTRADRNSYQEQINVLWDEAVQKMDLIEEMRKKGQLGK